MATNVRTAQNANENRAVKAERARKKYDYYWQYYSLRFSYCF